MRRSRRNRKVKLTPSLLRRIVLDEQRKLSETLEQGKDSPEDVKPKEVDAADQADSLAHDVDYIKALKIAESRATRKIRKIREARRRLRKRIMLKL